jgi:hypothetical protein
MQHGDRKKSSKTREKKDKGNKEDIKKCSKASQSLNIRNATVLKQLRTEQSKAPMKILIIIIIII